MKRHDSTADPKTERAPGAGWLWRIAVAGILLIPLIYLPPAQSAFRVPKLLLLQLIGILLVTGASILFLFRPRALRERLRRDPLLALAAAALIWCAVTTALSSSARISLHSLLTVVSGLAIFTVAHLASSSKGMDALYLVFPPAILNSIFTILQSRGVWYPLIPDWRPGKLPDDQILRVSPIALLGNRNDVGAYLLLPVLLALGLLLFRTRWRIPHALLFAVLLGGLAASRSRTSIATLAVAAVILLALRWPRAGAATLIAAGVLLCASFALPQVRTGLGTLTPARIDKLLTDRGIAWASAFEMASDHPVFGIGPGMFPRFYFHYKIAAAKKYPGAFPTGGSADSFGEAHNDPLQFAAEGGFPALFLFLAALVTLGIRSFRTSSRSGEPSDFSRFFALPCAAALGISSLAQFPMQLASTIAIWAFVGGLCAGWSHDEGG